MKAGDGPVRPVTGAAILLAGLMQATFVAEAAPVTTTVACGQVVTSDVVLEADVGPCPESGFQVLRTDGLTIDLNGHRVIGPNNASVGTGIRVFGSQGVTVKDGTVTGFEFGVRIEASKDTTVTGMDVVGNTGSITTTPSGLVSHTGAGIYIDQGGNNRVTGNQVRGNGPQAGIVIGAQTGPFAFGGNRIEGNLIQGNAVTMVSATFRSTPSQVDAGVWIAGGIVRPRPGQQPPNGNIIRGNQIVDNGWHGVYVEGLTAGNIIVGNQISRNGYEQVAHLRLVPYGNGIYLAGSGNVVERNVVTLNGGSGIEVFNTGQKILGNSALFNLQRPNPLPNFDLFEHRAQCAGNVWSGNRFQTYNDPCVTA